MSRAVILVALSWLSSVSAVAAHTSSNSYLNLTSSRADLVGQIDVALRDLDDLFALSRDGALTWGELRRGERDIVQALQQAVRITDDRGPCAATWSALSVIEHADGMYARVPVRFRCLGEARTRRLSYSLLFALDAQHRAIVRLGGPSGPAHTFVLGPSSAPTELGALLPDASAPTSLPPGWVAQGFVHILSGLDHVLFLLALLLPAVFRPRDRRDSTGAIRLGVRDVVKVVTAFTLAHSLTLALSALGVVSMNARVIEPAIALSVALAALDNLWPVFGANRWSVAFALGLLHGFGFSSVLTDAGASGTELLRSLALFNCGVELGQLAIVAALLPLSLLAYRAARASAFALLGSSFVIAAISLVWFVQRIQEG